MLVGVHGALEAVGPDWVNVQVGGHHVAGVRAGVSHCHAGQRRGAGSPPHHTADPERTTDAVRFPGCRVGGTLRRADRRVRSGGRALPLSILSELGEDGFRNAVASEDVAALARAQGVSRRIAQRVVLELRGKLPDADAGAPAVVAVGGTDADAVEALTALGMPLADARQAIASLDLPADALGGR